MGLLLCKTRRRWEIGPTEVCVYLCHLTGGDQPERLLNHPGLRAARAKRSEWRQLECGAERRRGACTLSDGMRMRVLSSRLVF